MDIVAWTDQLKYHPGPQLGLGLAHPNICPIKDMLELRKVLFLWNNSCNISMTQGGHGILGQSFGDDTIITVYQKPEALNQTNYSLQ